MILNRIKNLPPSSNNRFKSILIVTLCLLYVLPETSYGQFDNSNQTLRSNLNSSSAEMGGKPNVNLYNGVIDITNELGILHGRNGAALPISQSYQSSGIKVQDYASIIGLGWKLNVISSISRNVRGLPDEGTAGYFGGQKALVITQPLNANIMDQIADGLIDTEPDQFFLNINGSTQEFAFDKNGIPHFSRQNNFYFVQTPMQTSNPQTEWVVRDISGNQYVFGGNSGFVEESNTTENRRTGPHYKSFTSSWVLKSIYLFDNNEKFNFTYSSGSQITYQNYKKNYVECVEHTTWLKKKYWLVGPYVQHSSTTKLVNDTPWDSGISITILQPKYLNEIRSSNERVVFIYSLNREDLQNGRKLSNITFETLAGSKIRKLEFITSYRSSLNPTGIPYDKRLMLDKVKLNNSDDSRNITLFEYRYNVNNLPSRNSPLTDHWGYFSSNGNWFNPITFPMKENFKEPTLNLPKACSLENIIFETGGIEKYYFENNDYFNGNTNKMKLGGGLRISKVEKWISESSIANTIYYSYKDINNKSTGRIAFAYFPYVYSIDNQSSISMGLNSQYTHFQSTNISPPANPYQIIDTNVPYGPWANRGFDRSVGLPPQASVAINVGLAILNMGGRLYNHSFVTPFSVHSSETFNDLSTNSSGLVGYSNVTVSESGNGKEVFEFTDFFDYPDNYLQFTITGQGKQVTQDGKPVYLSNTAPPFAPGTSKAYARGLIKHKTVYDSNGNLLDEVMNIYSEKTLGVNIAALRCFKAKIYTGNYQSIGSDYNVGTYDLTQKTMVLTSEHKIFPLDITNTYTYDTDYPLLLTKKSSINSKGAIIEENYFYVKNATGNISYSSAEENGALSMLKHNKQWGVNLGQKTKVNSLVSSESKIGFSNILGNILPYKYYESLQGGNELKISSLKYDSDRKLISFKDDHLQTNSLLYTTQGENIKLKIVNAEATNGVGNEVFFEDFEENGVSGILPHTGSLAYSGGFQINFTPPNSKDYILTYWFLDNGIWKFSGRINYTMPTLISGIIDDLCICPSDSRVSSFTYNNINQISSEINTSNQTTFYEYDDFNRLMDVMDHDRSIVKHYEYNLLNSNQ